MKISLALGGGGSKAIAHLGVLRFLESQGIQVAAIAGTSAGGIVAALYAAGYSPDEIMKEFAKLDFYQMYRHDPGDHPSLLGVAGVRRAVNQLLDHREFSDLKIPAVLVAVDLRSGNEIELKDGLVSEAVMATIALPGIFPPVQTESYFLVDGGLLDPVPVAPVRALAPSLPVVAVVLNSPPSEPRDTAKPPRIIRNMPFVSTFSHLRLAQALNIFIHSIEVSSSYTTELRLKMDKPDLILRPDVENIGLLDKVEVEEVVRIGEQATAEMLPELKKAARWDRALPRFFTTRRGS